MANTSLKSSSLKDHKMSAQEKIQTIHDAAKCLVHRMSPQKDGSISSGMFNSNMPLSHMVRDFSNGNASLAEVYSLMHQGQDILDKKLNVQKREQRGAYGGPWLTSADFANLLSTAIRKQAVASYENLRGYQSFADWIHNVHSPNFKPIERPQLGQAGGLEEVLPGGEPEINASYHRVDPDRVEKYNLKSYKRSVAIDKQAFISDQTGEFEGVFSSVAAAAELEANLVAEQLQNGQVGGSPTYMAGRGNDHTAASLEEGVKMMMSGLRKQKGFLGSQPLNLELGHLVVPASLELDAHKLRYNLFGENMDIGFKVNTEARLDENSKTYIYGIAKQTDVCPFIDLALCSGSMTPRIDMESGFINDVLCFTLTHYCGSKVINFESGQRCEITG